MTAGSDASTEAREIRISRTFDAPRELVFDAWTNPQHVEKWWGPRGFTTTNREMDVRPGGTWRFNMHGLGRDFPNRIDFREVVRPERLVYDHGSDDGGPPHFHVTITFTDEGGRTRIDMRTLFPTVEAREFAVKTIGAIEGGNQTLDRFAEHLASL